MRIPESFIADLVSRIDIVEYIGEFEPLKKDGKNYKCLCPFHQEKTPSFNVSREKQTYHCFGGCDDSTKSGNVITYEMNRSGTDFVTSIKVLAKYAGMELPRNNIDEDESQRRKSAFSLCEKTQRIFVDNLTRVHPEPLREALRVKALQYLSFRGVTEVDVKRWGLGLCFDEWNQVSNALGSWKEATSLGEAGVCVYKPKEHDEKAKLYDFFRSGLVFPIRSSEGFVVSFAKRTLGDDKPKYLNGSETPIFAKHMSLYGIDQVSQSMKAYGGKLPEIDIVEGYIDVWAIARETSGPPAAVSPMGTAMSYNQFQSVFRYTDHAVVILDGDKAGLKGMLSAFKNGAKHIDDNRSLSFLILPEGQDPDSYIKANGGDAYINYRNKNMLTFSDFAKDGIKKSKDEARFLIEHVMPALDDMPYSLKKAKLVSDIQTITGIRFSEALPVSLKLNTGKSIQAGLQDIYSSVAEHLGKEHNLAPSEYSLDLGSPALKAKRGLPVPPLSGSTAKDIITRCGFVASALKFDDPVVADTKLSDLINKAMSGTPSERSLARCSLELYCSTSYQLKDIVEGINTSVRGINESVGRLVSSGELNKEQSAFLGNWSSNIHHKHHLLSVLIECSGYPHTQSLLDVVEDTKQELARLNELSLIEIADHSVSLTPER